jgi:hypothetical protein
MGAEEACDVGWGLTADFQLQHFWSWLLDNRFMEWIMNGAEYLACVVVGEWYNELRTPWGRSPDMWNQLEAFGAAATAAPLVGPMIICARDFCFNVFEIGRAVPGIVQSIGRTSRGWYGEFASAAGGESQGPVASPGPHGHGEHPAGHGSHGAGLVTVASAVFNFAGMFPKAGYETWPTCHIYKYLKQGLAWGTEHGIWKITHYLEGFLGSINKWLVSTAESVLCWAGKFGGYALDALGWAIKKVVDAAYGEEGGQLVELLAAAIPHIKENITRALEDVVKTVKEWAVRYAEGKGVDPTRHAANLREAQKVVGHEHTKGNLEHDLKKVEPQFSKGLGDTADEAGRSSARALGAAARAFSSAAASAVPPGHWVYQAAGAYIPGMPQIQDARLRQPGRPASAYG